MNIGVPSLSNELTVVTAMAHTGESVVICFLRD